MAKAFIPMASALAPERDTFGSSVRKPTQLSQKTLCRNLCLAVLPVGSVEQSVSVLHVIFRQSISTYKPSNKRATRIDGIPTCCKSGAQ